MSKSLIQCTWNEAYLVTNCAFIHSSNHFQTHHRSLFHHKSLPIPYWLTYIASLIPTTTSQNLFTDPLQYVIFTRHTSLTHQFDNAELDSVLLNRVADFPQCFVLLQRLRSVCCYWSGESVGSAVEAGWSLLASLLPSACRVRPVGGPCLPCALLEHCSLKWSLCSSWEALGNTHANGHPAKAVCCS